MALHDAPKEGVRVRMYQDYTYPNIVNHYIDDNG